MIKKFEEKKFNIPALKGISTKSIEEHLKLYTGYVKHANLILEKIDEYTKDVEKHAYTLGEIQRRFAFEFDGMRNHEYYFESLAGGAKALSPKSSLGEMLAQEFGSWDVWVNRFKSIALTRGIGWAILYYDQRNKRLLNAWIDEQHLGHLTGLRWVFGIDMWEHAFVMDYSPSGKKQYIEDFLANVNWETIEKNLADALR